MSIDLQYMSDFCNKLRKIIPFLTSSSDEVLEWAFRRLGRFNSFVPIAQDNTPQYGQLFENLVSWREYFTTNWDFSVPRCSNSYAHGLYSNLTVKTKNGDTITDSTVLVSCILAYLGQHFDTHFEMPYYISMTDGTPVTRNDYPGLKNSLCSFLNRQFVGWHPETSFPIIGTPTRGAVPVKEWFTRFSPVLDAWADKQLSLWKINGLDVMYRYKITGGTWTLNTTETFRAELIPIRCIHDYETNTFLSSNAPVIYKTGGSAQSTFQNGNILYTSSWKEWNSRECNYQVSTTCPQLNRGTDLLRPGTSASYSASPIMWHTNNNELYQWTFAEPVSQSYTPCLNYFIKGFASADEASPYWKRRCYIPRKSSWPASASDIWIDFERSAYGGLYAENPTHYFSEILNRDLTDQMTDVYQVFQVTTEMQFTNPYKYPIEVKFIIQKMAEVSDLMTNYLDNDLYYSDHSSYIQFRWNSGLVFTYSPPYVKSYTHPQYGVTAEGVAVSSPSISDPYHIFNGNCEMKEVVYYTSEIDGAIQSVTSPGWGTDINQVTTENANHKQILDTFLSDFWETDTFTVVLNPGESYLVSKNPVPLWTGSMNSNPFTSEDSAWPLYNNEDHFLPGSPRREPRSLSGGRDRYRVDYCWRPKPEAEAETNLDNT